MIVFATTPAFLEDSKRGAQSYPALWERIRTVLRMPQGVGPNKRNLIIELEPPGKRELKKAGKTLIELHGIAYSWSAHEAVTEQVLDRYVEKYMAEAPKRVYRVFLRTLVGILDALQQANGALSAEAVVNGVCFDEKDVGN